MMLPATNWTWRAAPTRHSASQYATANRGSRPRSGTLVGNRTPTQFVSLFVREVGIQLRVCVVACLAAVVLAIPLTGLAATAACPVTIPSSGFNDLGGLTTETVEAINCLKYYGITTGVTSTAFNPNGDVLRWQMALFLTREAVDVGITLPSGSGQGFLDIAGLDGATQTAINQLRQLGITLGTS